jgi:hypothetical protein
LVHFLPFLSGVALSVSWVGLMLAGKVEVLLMHRLHRLRIGYWQPAPGDQRRCKVNLIAEQVAPHLARNHFGKRSWYCVAQLPLGRSDPTIDQVVIRKCL